MIRTQEEMERIRDSGLELFHAAMMRAFDLGCQPHGGPMWCGIQTDFLKAAGYFEEAQTPGLRGGLTSNMRLQALALLEAASVGIDAGQDVDMAISLQAVDLFEELGDRTGVAAALVPLNVNSRAMAGFEFGFDFGAVLDACALAIPDGRVKDALLARKADAEKHANRLGHVFPERDSLALAIYHTAVGFEPWRRVFERGQREPLPHFELEIAAILIAYLVGVATAVTSEIIKDLIKFKKKVKETSEEFVTRAELDEKLRYLLEGYNLRDYHLRHPEELDLATFTAIWKALHNKQAVLSEDEKRILQHFRQAIPSFRVSEDDADPFASARKAVEDVLLADETETDK